MSRPPLIKSVVLAAAAAAVCAASAPAASAQPYWRPHPHWRHAGPGPYWAGEPYAGRWAWRGRRWGNRRWYCITTGDCYWRYW